MKKPSTEDEIEVFDGDLSDGAIFCKLTFREEDEDRMYDSA